MTVICQLAAAVENADSVSRSVQRKRGLLGSAGVGNLHLSKLILELLLLA